MTEGNNNKHIFRGHGKNLQKQYIEATWSSKEDSQ